MLDAVYVDTVEEKSIVAIQPKPAFLPLFEVATTREGSGVALLSERATTPVDGPESHDPCLWWRRGRVERYLQHGLLAVLIATWGRGSASKSSCRFPISITKAPYSLNQPRIAGVKLDLPSQVADINPHHIQRLGVILAPNLVE